MTGDMWQVTGDRLQVTGDRSVTLPIVYSALTGLRQRHSCTLARHVTVSVAVYCFVRDIRAPVDREVSIKD